MAHQFRKAFPSDASKIWEILQQAIFKRKKEGSNQWQDGYPNPEVIKKDISKEKLDYINEVDAMIKEMRTNPHTKKLKELGRPTEILWYFIGWQLQRNTSEKGLHQQCLNA